MFELVSCLSPEHRVISTIRTARTYDATRGAATTLSLSLLLILATVAFPPVIYLFAVTIETDKSTHKVPRHILSLIKSARLPTLPQILRKRNEVV
jgi:hypothetical protein